MEISPDSFPDISAVTKKHGDRLPQWTHDRSIYHVTFRLHDSLPQQVLRQWQSEKKLLLAQVNLSVAGKYRLQFLVSEQIEAYLDQGIGSCLMRDPEIAGVVSDAVTHFDGDRYLLHAWCVMPNHVHLIIQPQENQKLDAIVHSLKSFTAHQIGKLLAKNGPFWQPEYFDHIIRNEASYVRAIEYVVANPQTAGLKDWKWVSNSLS